MSRGPPFSYRLPSTAGRASNGSCRSEGGHVEFWTRLNPHDWAAGVSDPPALLDYLANVGEERVSLRVHRALHAKIYQVDGAWSWIGSPNLSRSAFTSNIELVAELSAEENDSLGTFVNDLRSSLKQLPLTTLRAFVEVSRDAIQRLEDSDFWENEDFQAAVALADEVLSPEPTLSHKERIPNLQAFIESIQALDGEVPRVVVDHYYNFSNQNRQGHVKQSYYALIQFLSNQPGNEYIETLQTMALDAYPNLPHDLVEAWVDFLDDNAAHKDDDLGYSFSTLRNILPERMGGYVTAGGGAIGTFTRIVPLVARFLSY